MELSYKFVVTALAAEFTTVFVFIFGEWDVSLQCIVIAIVLDYISGLIKGFCTKTLSSKIGIQGLLKKVGILCIVALATMIDHVTGESGAIRTLVIYYFVANEGLSVLENLAQAGLPIPDSIKKALKALKKGNK